jgi:hypothetical protein
LRIGVHIGDIVHQGDDIYGDGVNIAARLEAAGAPGHVLISDDVRRQISGRVDAAFHEVGPVALKNIAEPVRVWSWPEALAGLAITSDAGRKPGIHVAQFEARGAEAMELAAAVRDDLATAFARQSGIDVITDAEAADYIVAGAIRGAGDGRPLADQRQTDGPRQRSYGMVRPLRRERRRSVRHPGPLRHPHRRGRAHPSAESPGGQIGREAVAEHDRGRIIEPRHDL